MPFALLIALGAAILAALIAIILSTSKNKK